jgi:hypothetical protein
MSINSHIFYLCKLDIEITKNQKIQDESYFYLNLSFNLTLNSLTYKESSFHFQTMFIIFDISLFL